VLELSSVPYGKAGSSIYNGACFILQMSQEMDIMCSFVNRAFIRRKTTDTTKHAGADHVANR
jgi:hypothetical protein